MNPRVIAHRGNLNGPDPATENSPEQIEKARKAGFDVEIDVWFVNGQWYTGHNAPQYKVDFSFLDSPRYWLHAKNIEALHFLTEERTEIDCDFFWHQNDDYTLTNNGFIWTLPGKPLPEEFGIAVLPESIVLYDVNKAWTICTDYANDKNHSL